MKKKIIIRAGFSVGFLFLGLGVGYVLGKEHVFAKQVVFIKADPNDKDYDYFKKMLDYSYSEKLR